jgi:hypothetical protein
MRGAKGNNATYKSCHATHLKWDIGDRGWITWMEEPIRGQDRQGRVCRNQWTWFGEATS